MTKTLPRDTNAGEEDIFFGIIFGVIGVILLLMFLWYLLGVYICTTLLVLSLILLTAFLIIRYRKKVLRMEEETRALKEWERAQKEQGMRRDEKRIEKERFEEEQRAKGLVEFKDKWGTPEQVKKWEEIDIGLENNFADYSPYEFEEFIAKLFRKMGYTAETTSRVKDFGTDVIARKDDETIAIQVKKNAIGNNVGAPVIQQTLGSMWRFKADKSIVITTSDFTVQAEEQAKDAPVELWNGKILERIVRKYFIDLEADGEYQK